MFVFPSPHPHPGCVLHVIRWRLPEEVTRLPLALVGVCVFHKNCAQLFEILCYSVDVWQNRIGSIILIGIISAWLSGTVCFGAAGLVAYLLSQ